MLRTCRGDGCFRGEMLGEGGGVGVMDWRCFSATELRIPVSTDRKVGT